MKAELKAKFLQHLNQKKQDEGFTLIELLVVIIIIGILSAIALPSFLNQAAKAKQSEAKQYVGAINRAQQTYRLQNTQFANASNDLQIGLPSQTANYTYNVVGNTTVATANANSLDASALKSYAGAVVIKESGQSEAIACQTNGVTNAAPGFTISTTTAVTTCGANSQAMQ